MDLKFTSGSCSRHNKQIHRDTKLANETRRIIGLLKEGRSRDELFTMLKKAVMDDLSESSDPA